MSAASLTVHDRCDHGACTAQARARVGKAELDLVFCGHHFARLEPDLVAAGFAVTEVLA